VGEVKGTSYTILISQDLRSLPGGVSFLTDAYIFPSNHANDQRSNHVAGTSDSPDLIDWDDAPDGTGLAKQNCGAPGHGVWNGNDTSLLSLLDAGQATENMDTDDNKNPVMARSQFNTGDGSGNSKMSIFGLNLNTTAWLGYSYNLFYVRTTRCSVPTLHCVTCDIARRRLLEDKNSTRAGAEPTNFHLMMTNPKYIMDPSHVTGDFSERAEYDPFSSAVAVALFGLVSMLF